MHEFEKKRECQVQRRESARIWKKKTSTEMQGWQMCVWKVELWEHGQHWGCKWCWASNKQECAQRWGCRQWWVGNERPCQNWIYEKILYIVSVCRLIRCSTIDVSISVCRIARPFLCIQCASLIKLKNSETLKCMSSVVAPCIWSDQSSLRSIVGWNVRKKYIMGLHLIQGSKTA